MPGRAQVLVTGQIYHVFNRGIDHRPTFVGRRELGRGKELINFYQFQNLPVRYSVFQFWSIEKQLAFFQSQREKGKHLVDIIAYCLMPNHFHILLRQSVEGGISRYLSNFQNSYTRYYNTRKRRVGPLFLDQFKAVRIENDEQLFHVSRYIHLNPLTSYVVKAVEELTNYQWSSLPEYLGNKGDEVLDTKIILTAFKGKNAFTSFVFDQVDYQRKLAAIRHLSFEEEQFSLGAIAISPPR